MGGGEAGWDKQASTDIVTVCPHRPTVTLISHTRSRGWPPHCISESRPLSRVPKYVYLKSLSSY